MKVQLKRDEIEKAIKQYIETQYLSSSFRFEIEDIDLIEEIFVDVEVRKVEQIAPYPYSPQANY